MAVLDCRGLACPQPVVSTKQALDQMKDEKLIVIVDNAFSCNNVQRFVQNQGCSAEIEDRGHDFYIHIQKANGGTEKSVEADKKARKVVVYISSQYLGSGDEDLGSFLMKAFLKTLIDFETQPDRLILVNSGVQLAAEGSKALESLQMLSEKGVEVLCCGTCVDFYELKGKVKAGRISNMYEIIESMMDADRVIKP